MSSQGFLFNSSVSIRPQEGKVEPSNLKIRLSLSPQGELKRVDDDGAAQTSENISKYMIEEQEKGRTKHVYLLSSAPERSFGRHEFIQSDPQSEIIHRVVVLLSFQQLRSHET